MCKYENRIFKIVSFSFSVSDNFLLTADEYEKIINEDTEVSKVVKCLLKLSWTDRFASMGFINLPDAALEEIYQLLVLGDFYSSETYC